MGMGRWEVISVRLASFKMVVEEEVEAERALRTAIASFVLISFNSISLSSKPRISPPTAPVVELFRCLPAIPFIITAGL